MEVIPVLDLKAGAVVRGVGGRREAYAPWVSPLSQSSEPRVTLQALLRLWPFRAVYIADLDAIMRADSAPRAYSFLPCPPVREAWIDAGLETSASVEALLRMEGICGVLGTESQRDPSCVAAMRADPRVVLSLDFKGDAFLGPPELLADTSLWPDRVIVMTLDRVGEGQGPDVARIAQIAGRAGNRRVYAAGGVRDNLDLRRVADAGAVGALVATALHNGRIGREALIALNPDS